MPQIVISRRRGILADYAITLCFSRPDGKLDYSEISPLDGLPQKYFLFITGIIYCSKVNQSLGTYLMNLQKNSKYEGFIITARKFYLSNYLLFDVNGNL